MREQLAQEARRPREDHGFFGPGSPTWRVYTHPSAYIAFQRAVTIETLDPFLTAAVVQMEGVYRNPRRRFERTVCYFLTVAIGDGRAAIEASRILHRVHAGVTGTEPVSGRPFAANDPDSQLWIHVTAWHSLLYCYEKYGPGKLSPEDEEQYWSECAIAAELQTIDTAKVPRTREEVRAYFASQRPRLALSADGHDLFHYFLRPKYRADAPLLTMTWRGTSYSTIATLPKWMRRLSGVRQGPILDWIVTRVTRLVMRAVTPMPVRFAVMRRLAPAAVPVMESALRGAAPLRQQTVTPDEVRVALPVRAGRDTALAPTPGE